MTNNNNDTQKLPVEMTTKFIGTYSAQGKPRTIIQYNSVLSNLERCVTSETYSCFKLQAIDYNYIRTIPTSSWESADYTIKLIEDIGLLAYHLTQATTRKGYTLAVINFCKLRINKPIFTSKEIVDTMLYFDTLFETRVQSAQDVFETIKGSLHKYEALKASPLYTKLYKFLMYCLSMSLFDKIGITMDKLRYSHLEQEAIRRKHHLGIDFVHSFLDTLVFLCECGYQCMQTGSMDPIYHSGTSYSEWYTQTLEIKRKALFLSNPEPHGFDTFSFLADLNDLIEKGDAMSKYTTDNMSRLAVTKILHELQIIKANETTKRAAQKDRKAPFSVLLYGASSIAKSTLTKILFYHYGKLFNLPTSPEFKYTRNPVDQFWSNFNSTQWCVQLDDIGFMHPNVASAGDPSLMEMLQVVNNVPFVPTQAALEDKGRTPLKSRLVLATTNTEHLNTLFYFSCPLAVQRRLPFVIDVKPKPEYTKDGCMLDGDKVPHVAEGEYPDFWHFVVKRVVPLGARREGQRGTYEQIANYDNIYDFLDWFSETAIHYESLQDKAVECNDIMEKIQLCKCLRPLAKCKCAPTVVQSDDDFFGETEWVNKTMANIKEHIVTYYHPESHLLQDVQADNGIFGVFKLMWYTGVMFAYLRSPTLQRSCDFLFGNNFMFNHCLTMSADHTLWRSMFNYIGHKAQARIGSVKLLCSIALFLTSTYGIYKLISHFMSKEVFNTQGDEEITATEVSSEDIGRVPIAKDEERVNVWYKDDYQVTTFDVSAQSLSMKGLERGVIESMLLTNCVFIFCHKKNGLVRPSRAICLKGNIYLANNHCIPTENFEMTMIQAQGKDGTNSNLKFLVTENDIIRYPDLDLAFLNIRYIPPKKDITSLFSKESLRGNYNCAYLARNRDGTKYTENVRNVIYNKNFYVSELDQTLKLWTGVVSNPTINGHCGSLLLAHSVVGPIILGIHVLGAATGHVGALSVTYEMIVKGIDAFGLIHIQSGQPLLSSVSAPRVLGALHRKSPIRYIPEGTANVYGSFEGFRPNGKSSVEKSILHDALITQGYTLKYGPPVMKGWEPYYNAIVDMVRPVTQINTQILHECVETFTADILQTLTTTQLSEVHVYDNITAINGADGVTYVDKMNRNTSAGNPWKKSKKFFMTHIPSTSTCTDPIEFDKEIMDRVNECIDTYKRGKRFHPVFCAHLKDDPMTFKKIDSKNTRLFTGAPVDWCIVNRKYLLSVIRLVQNNRYLFESAPGTVAQSLEWEEMRDYLTQFGDNRMVAGDYAKFDKRMSSLMIMASFDIIISICKAAGYSQEELQVVHGLAVDTAYPTVDFNGDLIEFYGSNPSGHPLTVIINGLANSLYMRYCYHILNPDNETKTFKQNVALMTYGDDNVMGVHPRVPFFNHTAIQNTLQKIDIKYTMADKEAESIPYIHIDNVSFLKRTWRYDRDIGFYVCPLEHDSIEKMLLINVQSRTITPEAQAIAVISTALREYFWYGKHVFNEKTHLMVELVSTCDLHIYVQESTFPTWEKLRDEFLAAYPTKVRFKANSA
jgi:hypothetical protein